MDFIQKIMAEISAHNALHPSHGHNCSCHDQWSFELKQLVSGLANSQQDIRSFSLLCHYFTTNPPTLEK